MVEVLDDLEDLLDHPSDLLNLVHLVGRNLDPDLRLGLQDRSSNL